MFNEYPVLAPGNNTTHKMQSLPLNIYLVLNSHNSINNTNHSIKKWAKYLNRYFPKDYANTSGGAQHH